MKFHIIGYLWFFITIVAVSSDKCVQTSPCSCEYEDEKTINLKPLSQYEYFLNFTVGNLTYFFHPCTDKKLSFLPKGAQSQCSNTTSSLCLYDAGPNIIYNLGNTTDVKVEPSAQPGLYDIVYKRGTNETHITLICTTNYGASILYASKSNEANKHKLMLFSSVTCEHYEYKGLSTGSVLVILFMLIMTAYFLGGVLTLHFLRGARGREMIPNIDFWTDLPILVKDGVVFLQNGCKPTVSNSDSYDRI